MSEISYEAFLKSLKDKNTTLKTANDMLVSLEEGDVGFVMGFIISDTSEGNLKRALKDYIDFKIKEVVK